MKKLILFILLIVAVKVFSQQNLENYEIGYYFDIDGNMIDGYFDCDYEPDKTLKVTYTVGENFTPGYYYDLDGNKISGLLEYSYYNTYFKFKEDENSKAKTIKPDECIGYVVGTDTFTVIQNFQVQTKMGPLTKEYKEYAEVLDEFNNLTFYKHTSAGLSNPTFTYLVKSDSTNTFISFPKNSKKFKETTNGVFSNSENILQGIQSGKYKEDDIPVLLKLLKYKYKFENNEPIYYDQSWDETNNPNKSNYYSIVSEIHDSVYHLKYFFNDGQLIYEGEYTSFYPHRKRGYFIWYYPNGTIRRKASYFNNKLLKMNTFFTNGNTHYECELSFEDIVYKKVFDINGKNILDNIGNGKELFYDSISNKSITRDFKNFKLIDSYYEENGRNIFQFCDINSKVQVFPSNLNYEVKYPINSVINNSHGFTLIKFIVEPSGLVSKIDIIKSIDEECDSVLLKFLSSMKQSEKWKPAKNNKEKVPQEIVLCFDFSINGFSRYRNNYYYYNNWMFQQQKQMMRNAMPTPTYKF